MFAIDIVYTFFFSARRSPRSFAEIDAKDWYAVTRHANAQKKERWSQLQIDSK